MTTTKAGYQLAEVTAACANLTPGKHTPGAYVNYRTLMVYWVEGLNREERCMFSLS